MLQLTLEIFQLIFVVAVFQLFPGGVLQGKNPADKFQSLAHLKGQIGGALVMQGDQPPQHAVFNDRNTGGCPHTHIF